MLGRLHRLVPVGIAVVGIVALAVWVKGYAPAPGEKRLPAAEAAGEDAGPAALPPTLALGNAKAQDLPGVWPNFRGPDWDGVNKEAVPLARSWESAGPKVLWSVELCEGYAAAAVRNGRVYVIDYDEKQHCDALRCLSLADGKEIWRQTYPVEVAPQHGITRTIPSVTEQFVVSMGPMCHLICCDAVTGQYKWGYDLPRDFAVKVPGWWAGQCPFIDGPDVIVGVGGKDVLVMAIELATGNVKWKTPNTPKWKMSHTSIVPMTLDGKKTYVYSTTDGVAWVSAEDGTIVCQTPIDPKADGAWQVPTAAVATPIVMGDGRVFFSGGYNAGAKMIKVEKAGDGFVAKDVYKLPWKVFGSEQQTPILYQGFIYNIRPDGQLVCLNPADGKLAWASKIEYGKYNPFLIADGVIFVVNDEGVLSEVEATNAGFKPIAQAKVFTKAKPSEALEPWGPMALASGRLILRDVVKMVCLDVTKR